MPELGGGSKYDPPRHSLYLPRAELAQSWHGVTYSSNQSDRVSFATVILPRGHTW
jgi:hypothetical protein